jgi:hypothetical protein
MTPPVIHLWWDDTPPPAVEACADAWKAMHPGWVVHLWGNEPDLPVVPNTDSVTAVDLVRHRSNLIRWWLLVTFGGVWVDCDTEPLAPLDPLINTDSPFCGSVAGPEATIIGGPAGHRLFTALYEHSQRTTVRTTAPHLSGAHLLARYATDDLRVLEPGAFFDRDRRGRPIRCTGRRYARHQWQTSGTR